MSLLMICHNSTVLYGALCTSPCVYRVYPPSPLGTPETEILGALSSVPLPLFLWRGGGSWGCLQLLWKDHGPFTACSFHVWVNKVLVPDTNEPTNINNNSSHGLLLIVERSLPRPPPPLLTHHTPTSHRLPFISTRVVLRLTRNFLSLLWHMEHDPHCRVASYSSSST